MRCAGHRSETVEHLGHIRPCKGCGDTVLGQWHSLYDGTDGGLRSGERIKRGRRLDPQEPIVDVGFLSSVYLS